MKKSDNKKDKVKRSLFEVFTEVMGWLQIAASPFLIGLVLGTIIYVLRPNMTTLIIGITIAVVGLIIGIIWATRVWKKKGTVHFISRAMASPDFDNFNDESE